MVGLRRAVSCVLWIVFCLPAWGAAQPPPEAPDDHPLLPIVRVARDRLETMDATVRDYTCILVKRERVDGRLLDHEHLFVKLRHQQLRDGRVVIPFSVYLRFLGPAAMKGREVLYVEGKNQGKLIARRGGDRFAFMTLAIDPNGEVARQRNRYPITEMGIRNLIERLLEVAEEDMKHGECEVEYYTGAKVEGRVCTVVHVKHPVRRKHFRYHQVLIFIDDELDLPIRYESYDWPQQEGEKPVLLEEYTYLDVRVNVGLVDWDFDHRNKAYGFRADFEP